MRFLLDANLSRADDVILDRASADGYVLITADSDFPMMLALRRAATPSIILLRHVNELAPKGQGALLVANLPAVLDDLDSGAIVSLSPTRMRVRQLPLERAPKGT